MKVVVLNCGSSSVKMDVFVDGANTLSTTIERVVDHRAAVDEALARALADGARPDVVGHRVVHGGERFRAAVVVDADVRAGIAACVPLAPLHNPANLAGLDAAAAVLPDVPQVAVFDTAFHATLPDDAYRYAVPTSLYADHGVRRYGFHGTSHAYVAKRAAALLGRPLDALKLVTLHLGNGASAAAIDGGRSVDTSMGTTPLEGLVMGTRSGDLDPGVVLSLCRREGVERAEKILNKESGLLGLSGRSHDVRDLLAARAQGDAAADLALRVFARRAKKVVGAYAVVLGGLDALVFTGGIGEHGAPVRAAICDGLQVVGCALDAAKNDAASKDERDVATSSARARILIVPTDEEREIAEQAAALINRGGAR